MFKLPDKIPTSRSSAQEWTDFAEIKALLNSEISLLKVIKGPMIISDEIEVNGIEDETDRYIAMADEIAGETKYRTDILGEKYPFELVNNEYVIKLKDELSQINRIYLYLLLATRLNMLDNKVFVGLDGTKLFERLSAITASQYFGDDSHAKILGTAEGGGFRDKLKSVFDEIREGGNIHNREHAHPQDDKIDIIVWRGFRDRLPSQIIGFGQCKTGTNWKDSLGQLNPENFCNRWFTNQPIIKPLKIFFCAQYFPKDEWHYRAYDAGLIFDRFRIIENLSQDINGDLFNEISLWSSAAIDWIKERFS